MYYAGPNPLVLNNMCLNQTICSFRLQLQGISFIILASNRNMLLSDFYTHI